MMPRRPSEGGGSRLLITVIVGVLVIVAIGFALISTVFHRATITVIPQSFMVPVDASFEAAPNGVLLSFATTTVTDTEQKTVAKTGSEKAEVAASGTITITNSGSGTQRLITNTRFEAVDGRIYRIKAPITIPAGRSVNVTVYADQVGEKYNLTDGDFTVPGLKGSPQFDTIRAHTSSAIAGGFVGERAVVARSVRDAAIVELKGAADRAVREKLAQSLTEGQVILPNTVNITFTEGTDTATADGAVVAIEAVATAPVFTVSQLASIIAKDGGVIFDGPLTVGNLPDLTLSVSPSKTLGHLTVSVSGTALLVGLYDPEKLVTDLAGKDRRSIGTVLSTYPSIKDLRIAVYPFWRGTLPKDTHKLSLVAGQ